MEREKILGKSPSKGTAFRFLPNSMGWGRCNQWFNSAGVLERKTDFTHKCQGIGGSNQYCPISCKSKRTCVPKSGQFSNVLLFEKTWGKNPQFKPNGKTISAMVHGKPSYIGYSTGKKFPGLGRCSQQIEPGQGGLHIKQKPFQVFAAQNASSHQANSRHVCLTWKSPVEKCCIQASSLAGSRSRCTEMSSKQFQQWYANPPWKIINPWLHRLRDNKHIKCMLIVPFWVSSAWWHQILKLHVTENPS